MQNLDDKGLEQWTRKIMKETQLDSPGSDFTANVMNQIEAAGALSTESIYRPLISKKYWGLIAVSSLALIVLAFFVKAENSISLFQKFETWGAGIDRIDIIPSKLFPENMTYGILALLFFLGVQVFLLKQRHTRSLSI